jgi:hypothetical protein
VRPFRWTAIALPFLPLAYLDQQLAPSDLGALADLGAAQK